LIKGPRNILALGLILNVARPLVECSGLSRPRESLNRFEKGRAVNASSLAKKNNLIAIQRLVRVIKSPVVNLVTTETRTMKIKGKLHRITSLTTFVADFLKPAAIPNKALPTSARHESTWPRIFPWANSPLLCLRPCPSRRQHQPGGLFLFL
jgi:hypothetical protein